MVMASSPSDHRATLDSRGPHFRIPCDEFHQHVYRTSHAVNWKCPSENATWRIQNIHAVVEMESALNADPPTSLQQGSRTLSAAVSSVATIL